MVLTQVLFTNWSITKVSPIGGIMHVIGGMVVVVVVVVRSSARKQTQGHACRWW